MFFLNLKRLGGNSGGISAAHLSEVATDGVVKDSLAVPERPLPLKHGSIS